MYYKRACSDFISLSKGEDKYKEYFTVMEASEEYNNKECGVDGFVKEREEKGLVDRETESYHLPDVSHTRPSQVAQYGFRHALTKGISIITFSSPQINNMSDTNHAKKNLLDSTVNECWT